MTRFKHFILFATMILAGAAVMAFPALADGPAQNWEMGFQEAATPVAERIHEFHHMLLIIISAITVFVTVLLVYIMLRFNKRANPTPSTTTHNVPLEIIWTVVPVLILIVIVVPSMKLLYYADRTANPEMTLKVTGHQWYWEYEYPDYGDINFSAYKIEDKDIDPAKKQVRLLSTDNPVVLPVDTNIQVLVTSSPTDVLHSWAVPAFGVKTDAVPGRTNETWVRITKPGIYYGQCSEICGQGHAFMPIEIHAVSKEEFLNWVKENGGKTAMNTAAPVNAKFASIDDNTISNQTR